MKYPELIFTIGSDFVDENHVRHTITQAAIRGGSGHSIGIAWMEDGEIVRMECLESVNKPEFRAASKWIYCRSKPYIACKKG